jgi:SNF2 family DNA or RNA helicase
VPIKARVETSQNGRKVEVHFEGEDIDKELEYIHKIKQIPGATFVGKEKIQRYGADKPFWYFPLDMETCKRIKKVLGDDMVVGKFLRIWAKEQNRTTEKLRSIMAGELGDLEVLPEVLPRLYEAIFLGPKGRDMSAEERVGALEELPESYQVHDVKFMAACANPMNCNQPGIGKTIESIAAVFESGKEIYDGAHLVIAPLTSLDTVWKEHLEEWQDYPVLMPQGHRHNRQEELEDGLAMYYDGLPFWMVVNPDMFTLKSEFKRCSTHAKNKKYRVQELRDCEGCEEKLIAPFPELLEVEWNTLILDEFHKMGLTNSNTKTAQGISRVVAKKKMGLSGTPIGGKVLRLWGILHFLYPEEFSSKWRFAEQWMRVTQGYGGSKKIEDEIRPDVEDDFWDMLSTKMVRRTKAEVLPWLPDKQYISLWVDMDEKQKKQYEEFARDAEIRIEGEELSATSILAEYTRLKQFAFSAQTLETFYDEEGTMKVKPHPTTDSCKLPQIMRILEERGITKDAEEEGGDEKVVIFSQFTQIVDLITDYLREQGIVTEKITGAVTNDERTRIQRKWQEEVVTPTSPRVLVMNVAAGGVAITLDRASTAIMVDETWNPDDQEQAEDRIHRGSRIHQVVVYYIRTKGTIEQYIKTVTDDKSEKNFNILDARRAGLKAIDVEDDE